MGNPDYHPCKGVMGIFGLDTDSFLDTEDTDRFCQCVRVSMCRCVSVSINQTIPINPHQLGWSLLINSDFQRLKAGTALSTFKVLRTLETHAVWYLLIRLHYY